MIRILMTGVLLNALVLFTIALAPTSEAADPNWQRMPHQPQMASNSRCSLGSLPGMRRPDGCSGGAPHDRERFEEACWVHDICYMTVGELQWRCDRDFHKNMQQICREGGNYADCLISAQSMATAVELFGAQAFFNGQEWAGRSCGGVWWAEARAHAKQWCGNGRVQVYHVRCEFADGRWSTSCADMPRTTFNGRTMSADPKRLPDKAWTEVRLNC